MNPTIPFNLTFCNIDDDLVRVWGIADRERHEFFENILEMYKDRLNGGVGIPKSIADLAPGSLVLVKQGQQYKRGSIIRHEPGTQIFRVRLIDVGSCCSVPADDIRLTIAVPHLRAIDDAPCAQDYVLGDALVKPNSWSVEDVHFVNRALRVHGEVQLLATVAGKTLISWSVLESSAFLPFCTFLARRKIATHVSVDAVKAAVMRKFSPYSPVTTVPPPRIPQHMLRHPYGPPEMMAPMASPPMRAPPGFATYPRPQTPRMAPIPRMPSQPAVRAQQYKVNTLPVGSQHEVHVCCVIEGAQAFMIQVKKNVDEKLVPLMTAINDVNFQPEPVDQMLVGLMCLGRFSADKTLCRAVVSMVLPEGAANLLFVDFGNTEAVPFNDIYKLPPQFIEEPLMALPFTLAGLSNYPALLTHEARQIFEDLVTSTEYLLLSVTKPEIQLKQYCELYISDNRGVRVNVKQKVLDKVKLMKPAEYKKLSFKQNSSNDVIVSYVESASRFFVQLEVNQPLLDTLMASVEEYCITSAMKDLLFVEDVNENMAVCCQYTDNKWYRGLISEEPIDDGQVSVFYVDYGNQELVHFSKLRVMNNEMISKLPMQAVECRLDIDADFALREEVIEAFAELADLNSFSMKVINVLPANVLLVDLFDSQDQNVKDVLLSIFTEEKPAPSLADNASRSAASQGSGNWRERKSSSNDGDFTAFRREDQQQQQRSRGKSDPDDRGRRNSDYKRQDSRGFDETDDTVRSPTKEHSSSERWPQDRADKRSPRDEWPAKSGGRDDDRYGGKARDDGANRRFEREEGRWNSRDGERKPYRRQDDGDSRAGGSRDDDRDRQPYRKRDDSGSRSSRDGDFKKPYNRDDRRGGGGSGGGFRRNDDDWNRNKSDRNGEKSDSSWGAKKNDLDSAGRNSNSDWNRKNDDWNNKSDGYGNQKSDGYGNQKSDGYGNQKSDGYGNQKSDGYGNQKSDGYGNQKSDSWGNKKNDDWGNKKNDDWNGKKNDDWSGKKNDSWSNKNNDDWSGKKNDTDDWAGKKNDSDWKGKSSFDRDDRRPKRDDYKPRDGGYNSRDGNRQRGGGYGGQTDSFKSTPALSDGYPAGSQIAESDFQVGQQMPVEISWFLNPVHFFLTPAGNAEFRQLMETMQPDYPQRKNAELNSLSSGNFVAARAKDEIIYRAKVIQTRPGGATVSFVDYGNSESVSRNQIWSISSDHCSQPIQAMCCGLHNISSTGEGGQWSLPDDGEKYFGKEKYTVTFVECREESSSRTWFVNLADENNQDIADLLVADGLAVKNTVLKSEELYDIELLRDQIIPVFPGHIDSSKKFFVHIEPPKTEMIQQSIATLAETPESLVPLPTENICEGEFCLAMADDEVYYRAQILQVTETEKMVHVVYIDYGDENDVAFDAIKILPEYLMIYNPQIVECCLHEAESFTNEEAFHEALKETDFMIKVMDIIDNKLSVFVYDINGARLPYPVNFEESVDVLCSLPMLKACEEVFISHITADKVYLSRSSDTAYITDLCEQLMKHYDAEEPTKVPLEPGVFYAAKSKIFESWYRSILPSADSKEIYYIDYGNTEPVDDLLAVKPLEKNFFVSPSYCVAASTSIKFTCADLTPLIETVAPVTFLAKFERRPDGWYADLKCEKTGKTLNDFATECECSFEVIESKTDAKYAAFDEWKLNDEKRVSVAHVASPNLFHLHLAGDVERIETMQRSLQRAVRRLLPVVGPVDGLCAAQKSDGQWCRVAVSDQQTAFAVDFGETLTAPVMKKLPLSFVDDQSNYIVECSLNVNPVEDSWSDAAVSRFRDLVGGGKEMVAKLEFLKSPKLIDLIVDGVSVGSTLVNENLAQWKCHEVIVCHANSLSDFYIQDPELADDLYKLADELQAADAWESVEPVVDDLVVAKYDDDEQWYRAVVVKVEDVKYVRFIDYGNESACNQFRVLPDSLKSIAHFGSKCSLHTVPENVDDLNEKFVNLVSSADGSFTAYFLNRVEPMLVMLYYNNTAIEDVLQEKPTEVDLPTSEVPAEAVAFDSVAVCHINSPSSFYVQSETAPLDDVATALVEVENAPVAEPTVGSVVAALFPDDGVWYRAKICEVTEGVSVLFVDYGNTCVVEQLRQLPEKIRNVPALAKHCAFTLPAGLDQWPDIAKQRFAELTCEGNTIFKLNLLKEGDPAFVDLQDAGVNVADELATLCKADLTATSLLSSATKSSVLLSHVESLNELWIQFQWPQLDEMADEMAHAETFEAIDAADEGSLVAAMFDDDGVWYRAKVLKVVDNVYDVLFIDYGNRSSASSIKSLPADLVNLPALAKCCQLKDFVEIAENHVDAVVAKLKEMVDAAQPFAVHELVEIDGVNYVSLAYENDKDLTTEMRTFYNALVTSTSVSSQSENVEEALVNETAEPVQEVDVTENTESVDVPSEGVTDSEKVVETVSHISEVITNSSDQKLVANDETENAGSVDVPIENVSDGEKVVETVSVASEQITNSSCQNVVANDTAAVADETTDKDEQIPKSVESEAGESVPTENAEKAAVLVENGDKEPVSSPNAEKEPVSGENAEESICEKAEKVPEKSHDVIVTPADDSYEVTETPREPVVAENVPSDVEKPSAAEPEVSEDLSRGDGVAVVTPEKSADNSVVSGNRCLVVCLKDYFTETRVTTPSPPKADGGETLDTSGSVCDLTPDFKTPVSKFAFDAEDSFVAEASSTDDDSNYFESAVGPADTSLSSTLGDPLNETELVDSSMESRDDEVPLISTAAHEVVEFIVTGMTPKEFVERHRCYKPLESAPTAGQGVNESAVVCVPPLAKEEEFDSLESCDSVPAAGQEVALVDVHVPKSTCAQFYPAHVSEELQFADADETSADALADLLSGMTISGEKTSAPSKVSSRDEAPPQKVDSVETHDLTELKTDGDTSAQSKCDPEVEKGDKVHDHAVDLRTKFSSTETLTETRSTCNVESVVPAIDEPSQTGQLEAAKPSESDESTAVLAQFDDAKGDQVRPEVESKVELDSTIPDRAFAMPIESSSNEEEKSVSEKPVSEASESVAAVVGNEPPKCQDTFSEDVPKKESTSRIALPPLEPAISKASDESPTTDVKDDKLTPECEKPGDIVPDESDSSIATDVSKEFFNQLVASVDDEFNSTANPFIFAEDTLGLISYSSSDSEPDDIDTDSTSLTSCSNGAQDDTADSNDGAQVLNFSDVAANIAKLTPVCEDRNVAQYVSPSKDDSLALKDSTQSPTTVGCDARVSENVAQSSTIVKGDSGAPDVLPPTTIQNESERSSVKDDSPGRQDVTPVALSVKEENASSTATSKDDAQSPATGADSPTSRDVTQIALPVKEEDASSTATIKDDAQSQATGADSSASRDVTQVALSVKEASASSTTTVKDDVQLQATGADASVCDAPSAVGDSSVPSDDAHSASTVDDVREPENVGELSLASFRFVPRRRLPIRPELRPLAAPSVQDKNTIPEKTSNGATSAQDENTVPEKTSGATTESAPLLPAQLAVAATSEECAKPLQDDDGESLPSSGGAEVAQTLAGASQPADGREEAPLRQQSPTMDAPESAASVHDDNSSVYFDSCADQRLVEFSDDDQQPKSFTSSASDETSVASSGDADEAGPDSVIVSYVNTPDNFFVQRVVDEEALRNVEKQLAELEVAEITSVSCGADGDDKTLYGAEIDGRLYRVSVQSANCAGESGAVYSVCCVDYGRVCQTRKLFSLPDSLRSVEPLAAVCSLSLPYYLKVWPVNVCQEFERLVMTDQPRFRLKYRQPFGNVPIVDLVKGSRSISQRMKTLCEEFHENNELDAEQGESFTTDE